MGSALGLANPEPVGLADKIAAFLRSTDRACKLVVVGYELMDSTRAALLDGTLSLSIAHPLDGLAGEAISGMIRAMTSRGENASHIRIVPFDIYTREFVAVRTAVNAHAFIGTNRDPANALSKCSTAPSTIITTERAISTAMALSSASVGKAGGEAIEDQPSGIFDSAANSAPWAASDRRISRARATAPGVSEWTRMERAGMSMTCPSIVSTVPS